MTGTKNKSGGPRKGSGRKLKTGEQTKPMRIPLSLVPAIEKMIDKLRKKNLTKNI
jgi:hypothetical protein